MPQDVKIVELPFPAIAKAASLGLRKARYVIGARQIKLDFSHHRYKIFVADKFTCRHCGLKASKVFLERAANAPDAEFLVFYGEGVGYTGMTALVKLTLDHILPRSRLGLNASGRKRAEWNLQTLCQKCNQLKGSLPEYAARKLIGLKGADAVKMLEILRAAYIDGWGAKKKRADVVHTIARTHAVAVLKVDVEVWQHFNRFGRPGEPFAVYRGKFDFGNAGDGRFHCVALGKIGDQVEIMGNRKECLRVRHISGVSYLAHVDMIEPMMDLGGLDERTGTAGGEGSQEAS